MAMKLSEYKALYEGKDAMPGWDAIDRSLSRIHGEQEPMHWGTIIKGFLGGPDPIDGLSAYKVEASTTPHFHFCSYGFSSLYYDEDSVGGEFSGFGFELTFRLANQGETREELAWVFSLIQNLGRYVFKSGRWFEEGHWIATDGPIKQKCNSDIVGLLFVGDPELPSIETPSGRVDFLQMVGITESELNGIRSQEMPVDEVLSSLRAANPLLVTDLGRRALLRT